MSNEALFVVVSLATYFCAYQVIATMLGPFGLSHKLRSWIRDRYALRWQEEIVSCPVCLSGWIGLVLVPIAFWGRVDARDMLILWLGNAGACLIWHYVFTNALKSEK